MKLTEADIKSLRSAAGLQFAGGSMPYTYGEYQRREKLRRWRLLRFWNRRSSRWDWNCYDITERGQRRLEAELHK
jgi:hypothetical protein